MGGTERPAGQDAMRTDGRGRESLDFGGGCGAVNWLIAMLLGRFLCLNADEFGGLTPNLG
jgi:hypothetical protein